MNVYDKLNELGITLPPVAMLPDTYLKTSGKMREEAGSADRTWVCS